MSVDISKIKAKSKVKLKNGEVREIRGAYMSPQGLVFTSQVFPGSIVDRNIPAEDIIEVKEEN